MSGVSHEVINNKLDVDPKAKPVKQKKGKFFADNLTMPREKVDKLLQAG